MHIYIPTLSRPNKQSTLSCIPKKLLPKTHLVINKEEYNLYKKNFNKSLLFIVEKKINNIGQVRQYVLENSTTDFSFFLDDDMTFNVRKEGKLKKAEHIDFFKMYNLLFSWLKEGLCHVGISQRAGNNRILEDYAEITRMNNAYCYNVKTVNEQGVRFDRIPVMEDFDITLSLLKLGLKNRVTYQYAWSQEKSGAPGGCSNYRTQQVQRDAAFQLSKLHPGIVTIKIKKTKNVWEGIQSEHRTDVIIAWKKAFKETKRKGSLGWLYGK